MKTVDIFLATRKDIEQVIGDTAQGTAAPLELLTTPMEVVEQSSKELDPLFKDGQKRLNPIEANEFWSKAASTLKAPSKPDMLSYDQARQLGLTPEDES